MKKLKCFMICMLAMVLCAANILQPVCANAETVMSQTETVEVESEVIETESDASGSIETKTVVSDLAGTDEESAEKLWDTETESEIDAVSEPESFFETENRSEETMEIEVSEVCKVYIKFFGKGRIEVTDGEGNGYALDSDTLDRKLEFAEDEKLRYEIMPDEGYETERMDIYKGGAFCDSVKGAEKENKLNGEIKVDSDILFEIHFIELLEPESVAEPESDMPLETETAVETESGTMPELKSIEETEKPEVEEQTVEPFETDGQLSFLEGIEAETLALKLEAEIMPLISGEVGQVWGMYKIYANDNIIIDEFMPGFQQNDYSKIIQTGPTFNENTMTAYCIQFGITCPAGGYLTESDLTVTQKNWIGYALEFGWKQEGNAYDEAQYSDYTNRTEYAVTQAIIWACAQNKFGTDVGDAAINKVIQNTFDPAHAQTYYDRLKTQIFDAEVIPSFSSRSADSAPTITLEWNSGNGRYETSVNDANGVLSRYNYTCPGITISRNENTATIYTTGNYPNGVTASAVYTTPGGADTAVLWDGEFGNQDMVTYQKISTEIRSYIRIITEDVGSVELYKKSANPVLTDGNSCYSLAGAVYGVYNDSNTEVGRITTDNNGYGKLSEIPVGNYSVKEIAAPKGYVIDVTSYKVTVSSSQTSALTVTDYPQGNSVEILLKKTDKQTNTEKPSGKAFLAGAQFTVHYYDVQMDTNPADSGYSPIRTWVLKTDGNAVCLLNDKFKVSGDAFYTYNNEAILPLGTVTIQETRAPEGYLISEEVYVCRIVPGENAEVVIYNAPTIPNQVIRGDFEFIKNSEDGKAMADIPFKISSKTTGESYTVYSDKNGHVTTKNLWFGDGTPDESLGALPYDTYIIEEIACNENEDKILIQPFEVAITAHNVIENLGIIKNEYLPFPELDSVALGRETGDHTLPAEGAVAISESLECRNLIPGVPFSLRVKAVNPETGEVYVINGKELSHIVSFIPSGKTEIRHFMFEFSAVGMAGKSVTMTAELLRRGNVVAVHNQSLDDADQTVAITEMIVDTVALDKSDQDKILNFGDDTSRVTIIDEVSYEGFIPGRTYKAVTELVETATGNPVVNGDTPVSFETEFVPENKNGTFKVNAAFDVSDYDGDRVTVFQTVYDSAGNIIAEHKALDDVDQTLDIRRIKIETTAADGLDGDKTIVSEESVVIKDVVYYENLTPGKEHKMAGILMDKETNMPLFVDGEQIISEAVFIPKAQNGSVEVEFVFNAVGLQGKKLVVFEILLDAEGKILAEHKDMEDKGQTVEVGEIKIGTIATDKEDGDKVIVTDENITIKDTVAYENLISGRMYTIEGVLMDTANNKELLIDGKPVTGKSEFTPEEPKGSIDVEFTFDATGLEEMKITVFEKLLNAGGTVVAAHEDINDKDQTVHFKKPVEPETPETGDGTPIVMVMVICILAGGCLLRLLWSILKTQNLPR